MERKPIKVGLKANGMGDDGLICCSVGREVRAFSPTGAGAVARRLRGHENAVTGLATSSDGSLWTCSRDKTIRRWRLSSGEEDEESRVQAEKPIESMVIAKPEGMDGDLAIVMEEKRGGEAKQLRAYRLATGKVAFRLAKMSSSAGGLSVSDDSSSVAAFDKRTTSVWDLRTLAQNPERKPIALHHTKAITCADLAPNGDSLAAGDATGRVLVWRGLRKARESARANGMEGAKAFQADAPCSTLHWHASSVGCVRFSEDGAHLYTGGREGVLVQWDMEGYDRAYMPRIGAPISWLQLEKGSGLIASLADNSLRRVSFASRQQRLLAGGMRPHFLWRHETPARAAACVDPRSSDIAIASAPASVQLFDPMKGVESGCLRVTPREPVSPGIGEAEEGFVSHLAFSSDGRSLATVDRREEGGWQEDTLRFWDREGSGAGAGAPFRLSTRADDPHFDHLTALAHHPWERTVATASRNGEVRIWCARGKGRPWRCKAAGSYIRREILSLAFSGDGSCLAAGSEGHVVVWDHARLAAVGCLECPLGNSRMLDVAFLPASPLLSGLDETTGKWLAWHLPSLERIAEVEPSSKRAKAFSCARVHPTRPLVAVAYGGDVHDGENDMEEGVACVLLIGIPSFDTLRAWRVRLGAPARNLIFTRDDRLVAIGRSRWYAALDIVHEQPLSAMRGECGETKPHTTSTNNLPSTTGLSAVLGPAPRQQSWPWPSTTASERPFVEPIRQVGGEPSHALPPVDALSRDLVAKYLKLHGSSSASPS